MRCENIAADYLRHKAVREIIMRESERVFGNGYQRVPLRGGPLDGTVQSVKHDTKRLTFPRIEHDGRICEVVYVRGPAPCHGEFFFGSAT